MIPLKWQNICVLVVDDNSFMRELLVATLRSLGIAQAVAVPDCATAIERLKLSRTDPVAAGLGTVDLIMADYLMPGVDGILFLRWLRSDKQVPDRFVPFIMVSGAADQYVVEEARDAGVTEFLAKPIRSSPWPTASLASSTRRDNLSWRPAISGRTAGAAPRPYRASGATARRTTFRPSRRTRRSARCARTCGRSI